MKLINACASGAVVVCKVFIAASLVLGGPAPAAVDRQTSDTLAIEPYLTHVSTDKPIYRAGEKVYVRAVLLRDGGHFPTPVVAHSAAVMEIKGPKGARVTSSFSDIADSSAAFSWHIPGNQPGGEYTVRISYPSMAHPPAERKFDIRAYRTPRLNSQIVFLRDGYGPGDAVTATLHVERAEGGIPMGAKVAISARVDGEETWKGETAVDTAGNASASFTLPAAIARGEGVIAITVEDGGTVETASKTIPILLQTIDVDIYPEGGDLVAGLPNRVYLEAKTLTQKPADIAGIVMNAAGQEVATFRTEHEGRTRFAFTPAKGEVYALRVTEPAGIHKTVPLPEVKESGVVIATTTDVTARNHDVVVRVAATTAGVYGVVLSQRSKDISANLVTLKANQSANVSLLVPKAVDGALVATVYDDHKKPVAERLLFRQPDHGLKVQVAADRAGYLPGDKVTLRITTTDEKGKPVGAVVGLTVTDSSVLEMIDKREQAPTLPVMVLLENDVRNLSDAHVYLDETNPKAMRATDLLLGTQGWRRFATVDPAKFFAANGDAARRLLPLRDLILSRIDAERGRGNGQVQIDGLPLPGNDPLTLIKTLPGYRANPLGHQFDTIGGLPMTMINTVRDGLSVTDGFNPGGVGSNTILNPDMINEIRLILHPVDAERGRGNGQVLITTLPSVTDWRIDCGGFAGESKRTSVIGRFVGGGFGNGIPNSGCGSMVDKPWTIRQFAHKRAPDWTEGARSDFAETVYWNAGVRTDASNGLATVSFNLSDSVTSFRILADGFANNGALGSSSGALESLRPFFIEPKIPLQVTSGDVLQLPIGIVNGTSRELRNTEFNVRRVAGLSLRTPSGNGGVLRANERARRFQPIEIDREFTGIADLTIDAIAGPYGDTVSRKLDVRPLGFPAETSTGGMLESNGLSSFEFTLPPEIVPGSVSSSVIVYPTPLASMTAALQALIREPSGCFEQTSSTSYPMVMAQQYFMTHSGIDPLIIEKTKGLLETSYNRLLGFQSRNHGYEWFGGDPGHEALTAYGLMQFTDMSQVRYVDPAMLQNTRTWLLSRRDGNGAFNRNKTSIDSFGGAPTDTTNAYITWALVESGQKGLGNEIAFVKAAAEATEDRYILALAANILLATGDPDGARPLMDKLVRTQATAGNVQGSVTSITRSGGKGLDIETTALAVLAWMRNPSYAYNVEKGLKWIGEANTNGRFGSTQSTVLALRSIVAYDAAHARPKAPGRILLTLNGKTIGAALPFTTDTKGTLVLPEIARILGAGKHTIALKMEDGSPMPYSISVKYHSTLPDSAPQARIGIRVALKDVQIQEGGITEATVSISNKSDEAIPTPVAIVGIPGGLEVRHDQLKELVKSGRIASYEVIGREVVLYWRFLKASDQFDLPLSLVAAVPGVYTGPASRAYLYYTDEFKDWAAGLKVNITPR